jgi:hypothetical protein
MRRGAPTRSNSSSLRTDRRSHTGLPVIFLRSNLNVQDERTSSYVFEKRPKGVEDETLASVVAVLVLVLASKGHEAVHDV